MDNDDFRRGRPTCHKVFGDGIAVLAGDALLTIAFEIVSRAKPTPRYDMSNFLREIAVAAGSQKLIAGQVADLEAEGKKVKRDQLRFIHENKTAAMLTTSVRLGCDERQRRREETFRYHTVRTARLVSLSKSSTIFSMSPKRPRYWEKRRQRCRGKKSDLSCGDWSGEITR